jgi:DNA-binding NarL/FixJ family response regulator
MKRISVLLADDHAMVREGLRTLLEDEDDIEVVGEAENGRQAVELTQKLHPAVVVLDIALPQLNGLEATRIILHALPLTKVLILSTHSDDACVEQAAESGAAGYLLKQFFPRLLPSAIWDVQEGCGFFFPSIAKRLRARPAAKTQAHRAVGGEQEQAA